MEHTSGGDMATLLLLQSHVVLPEGKAELFQKTIMLSQVLKTPPLREGWGEDIVPLPSSTAQKLDISHKSHVISQNN